MLLRNLSSLDRRPTRGRRRRLTEERLPLPERLEPRMMLTELTIPVRQDGVVIDFDGDGTFESVDLAESNMAIRHFDFDLPDLSNAERPILEFDVGPIPGAAVVSSAALQLYITSSTGASTPVLVEAIPSDGQITEEDAIVDGTRLGQYDASALGPGLHDIALDTSMFQDLVGQPLLTLRLHGEGPAVNTTIAALESLGFQEARLIVEYETTADHVLDIPVEYDGVVIDFDFDGTFESTETNGSGLPIRYFEYDLPTLSNVERPILDFDISALPWNAEISSVRLQFHTGSATSSSTDVFIEAFVGDGQITVDDATAASLRMGRFLPFSLGTGLNEVELDPVYFQIFVGVPRISLRLQGEESPVNTSIGSLESSGSKEARLIVEYIESDGNSSPFAADDELTVDEDGTTTASLLGNDVDPDGDSLLIAATTDPAHGTLTFDDLRTVTYVPDENFHGLDFFEYTAWDGRGGASMANVLVRVTSVNDVPVAQEDAYEVDADGMLEVDVQPVSSLFMVSDAGDYIGQGESLSFDETTGDFSAPRQAKEWVSIVYEDVSRDSARLDFDSPDDSRLAVGHYPDAERWPFASPGRPELSVSWDGRGCNTISGSFTVRDVRYDAEGVVSNFAADFVQHCDGELPVLRGVVRFNDASYGGVLANDGDIDHDSLTAELVDDVTRGTLTLNADGSFHYRPDDGFRGADQFTYRATDGLSYSEPVTVRIDVVGINDAPVAANDSATTANNQAVTIDVLANDTDADGDSLRIIAASDPTFGTLQFTDEQIVYFPSLSHTGVDTFEYTITDGVGGTDTATVSVTVTPRNNRPNAIDDHGETLEGTPLVLDVLANDADADGDILFIDFLVQPAGGTVTLNPNETLTYTPDPGFVGRDEFSYSASDGEGVDRAFVTVDVVAVPPTVAGIDVNAGLIDPPDLPTSPQPTSWAMQRSDVRSIVVTFAEPVVVGPGDLVLTNLGIDETADPDTGITLTDEHLTVEDDVLTIRFDEDELPDGVYRLEILASVTDLAGNSLDGDGDGVPGESWIHHGDFDNRLFKMRSDFSGDAGISIFDFTTIAYWFGRVVPTAPKYVDLNDDNGVSIFDFTLFASRFRQGISFAPAFSSLASQGDAIPLLPWRTSPADAPKTGRPPMDHVIAVPIDEVLLDSAALDAIANEDARRRTWTVERASQPTPLNLDELVDDIATDLALRFPPRADSPETPAATVRN